MAEKEGMETVYFCKTCNAEFTEARLPNLNKVHRRCGALARVVRHRRKEE